MPGPPRALQGAIFSYSLAILLFELLLTRIFAVVLFSQYAHLALALALLGISAGAVVQHLWPSLLPEEGLERRLAWTGVGLGLSALVGIVAALHLPLLDLPEGVRNSYQETSWAKTELLNPGVYAFLLVLLVIPFGFAGLAFAGTFQRRARWIGQLYAVDLLGGAVGAALFIPALATLAGPDVIFLVLAIAGGGAVWVGEGLARRVGMGMALGGGVLSVVGAGREILEVRATAGFTESAVTATLWTPLTRIAVYELEDRTLILLDNTSASEVPRDAAHRQELAETTNRGLVYRIHPPGRAAVLAASAGPEVASAQHWGWTDIDAIDIAGEIFTVVRDRFPEYPTNPYRQPGVHPVKLDGRAAIQQSPEHYDVIQMVHANLWSAAGMLANTWSPALLETREAFSTYLDHLAPNGVLSFGRGSQTDALVRSAARALRDRGIKRPWRHIVYVESGGAVALIRMESWTEAEIDEIVSHLGPEGRRRLAWDPRSSKEPKSWKKLVSGPYMTDNRPYVDSWSTVAGALKQLGSGDTAQDTPIAALYQSFLVQLGLALVAGVALVLIPWLGRARSETRGRAGGWLLPYCAALGYGYLAVETILVHDLVLFVGHPTYAITVVVMVMLVASGLGSVWVQRWAAEAVRRRLLVALGLVVLLGGLTGPVAAPWLVEHGLGLSPVARMAITAAVLFPLGFVMGLPFPAGVRLLAPRETVWVPWGWAMNGWMSVVGSLATVLVARLQGYQEAFALALGVYLLALLTVAARRSGP